MKPKYFVFAIALALSVALSISAGLFDSFGQVKTRLELQQLIHGTQGHYSTMWRGTYYCGTKDGHHYIHHEIELAPDIRFRIRSEDLNLTDHKVEVKPYPLKKAERVSIGEFVEPPPK